MCGIVGFTGKRQSAPLLLEGLSKLEYRGYDSAGLAVRDGERETEIVKAKGRLRALLEKTNGGQTLKGQVGIGHTRWATHGEPSENNAHPHKSDDKSVIAVHNGIIENYLELREKLRKHGYAFYSQTDTEVAVKLIDYYLKKYAEGPIDALSRFMTRVRGSYAIAVLFKDYPEEIFVARKESPLIVGVADGETFIASDAPAILRHTRKVYYMDNMEIGRLGKGEAQFFNVYREAVKKTLTTIKWDASSAEKAGFEHFMLKEIYEQPKAVADTINALISEGEIRLGNVGLSDESLKSVEQVCFIGCGSAYHVGMVAQYVIEDLAKIPVRVELASEFRYRTFIHSENTLFVIVSQSGETADSLASLRTAKEKGAKTLAIVNVVGSSIAREADEVLYTLAGPEISVATTKAYATQLVATYAIAIALAKVRGKVDKEEYARLLQELSALPEKMQRVLEDKERIQWFSAKFAGAKDTFFLGRGLDYAVSLEGSLKMKELSYIHSEAYASGELKHGPISLIEEGVLVVNVLTQKALLEKSTSNMIEVKSRGAYIMCLTNYGNYAVEDTADFTVYIPQTDERFAPSLAVIPLQLMGYYVSVAKGLDVDKPRNLAKSVTVE